MKMKAGFNGKVIAESDKTEVVEGNQYFPGDSIKKEYFKDSETKYTCPWKGNAIYFDVEVDGKVFKDAAWSYPEPKEAAKNIAGHFAFDPSIEVSE